MINNMSRPRTKNDAVCPNPDCEYYLIAESKDIRKQGKNSAGHRICVALKMKIQKD